MVGRARGFFPAGRRSGQSEAQRDGRLDRARTSIRCDRSPNHHDASQRAAAPQRTVWVDDCLRSWRYGLRDGSRENTMSSTSEVTIGGLVGTRWKPALSVEVTDGIAIITFDLPNESVNKLSRAVKDEFVALVTRLERDTTVHAAAFLSGKPDVWIAGADIEEFLQLKTATDAERLSRDGQMLVDSIEELRVPIIDDLQSACLGGVLETAVAWRYRRRTDDTK